MMCKCFSSLQVLEYKCTLKKSLLRDQHSHSVTEKCDSHSQRMSTHRFVPVQQRSNVCSVSQEERITSRVITLPIDTSSTQTLITWRCLNTHITSSYQQREVRCTHTHTHTHTAPPVFTVWLSDAADFQRAGFCPANVSLNTNLKHLRSADVLAVRKAADLHADESLYSPDTKKYEYSFT